METPAPDQSFQSTCVIFMRNGGKSLPRSGRALTPGLLGQSPGQPVTTQNHLQTWLAPCLPPRGATVYYARPRTEIVYQMPQRFL